MLRSAARVALRSASKTSVEGAGVRVVESTDQPASHSATMGSSCSAAHLRSGRVDLPRGLGCMRPPLRTPTAIPFGDRPDRADGGLCRGAEPVALRLLVPAS
jgi:hypothetical protein